MTVSAVGEWPTNGHLIEEVARLGYIGENVLDLSYGKGNFWTRHRPELLVANDLDRRKGDFHFDVQGEPPPVWEARFGAVVWDGPYRMSGRRDQPFDESYGLKGYLSARGVMELLRAGMTFAKWCVVPGGFVLVKCQAQVCGGRKRWQDYDLMRHGETLGLELWDRFTMKTKPRPQPAGRVQRTSRSNSSTLLVFKATS